jgi:hypothetical protein
MYTFILVMTRYPKFQSKARQEIHDVIGRGRLPQIGDMASLPYIRSVITETFRWAPPLPLGKCTIYASLNRCLYGRVLHCVGFPHYLQDDNSYNDLTIPKGAIMVNIWYNSSTFSLIELRSICCKGNAS